MKNIDGKMAIVPAKNNLKSSAPQKLSRKVIKSFDDEIFIEICFRGTTQEVEDAIKSGADVNARTLGVERLVR